MYNRFLEYLKDLDHTKVMSSKGVKFRKLLHPVIYRVAPLTTKNRIKVLRREPLPQNIPIIFATTHGFKDDILCAVLTAKKHGYVLIGGLGHFYNTFDGITLWLNGTVIVDRQDKLSRQASKRKMIHAIELGTNIIIFPEGLWNKTENQLVQKLFPGVYDIAKATGALVVPIVSHLESGTCYTVREQAFNICDYDRAEGLRILRDKLATIKWYLMEEYSSTNRDDLLKTLSPKEYWHKYIESLIAEVDFYERDDEEKSLYIDKQITFPEEVFSHLQDIEYTRSNAFLLKGHM